MKNKYEAIEELCGWVVIDTTTLEIVWGSANAYEPTEEEAKAKADKLNEKHNKKPADKK